MEFVQVARWLAVLAALWVAGLPVARRLFPRFPDGGGSLALPVAMVGLLLPVYWVGQVHFGPATLVVGLLILLAAAAVLGTAGPLERVGIRGRAGSGSAGEAGGNRWRGTAEVGGNRWRGTAEAAAVFLVAFALLLAVRAAAPAIVAVGGEKLLDFGLLNGLLRADTLPPEDVWFAGESVRYYYGGHLLAALLTMAAGVRPPVAYNLAVATFYATLVTAVYGLAGAIADGRGLPRRAAGTCGACLAGLAGNLATPARFLLGVIPESVAARYGRFLLDALVADYRTALAEATNPSDYWFWQARHVVPDAPTVFPLWTFLNGDLRPHMVGATFLVLVAALGYAYVRTPANETARRRVLLVGAAGVVGAHLALVNTWDLPTTLGLVFLAAAFGDADPRSLLGRRAGSRIDGALARTGLPGPVRREAGRVAAAGAASLGTAVVATLLVAPFLLLRTAQHRGVGLFPPRSPVENLVLVYGVFLGVFAAYLAPWIRGTVGSAVAARAGSHARDEPGLASSGGVVVASLGGVAVVLAGVVLLDLGSVVLLGGLLAAAWFLLRRGRGPGYETVLFVAGLGLVLFVEVAHARVYPYDPNAPRWNTVYKVSMQAWVVWSVGAGVAATAVLARGWRAIRRRLQSREGSTDAKPRYEEDRAATDGAGPDPAPGADGGDDGGQSDWLRVVGVALVVVSLVGAGTFPVAALDARFEGPLEEPVGDWTVDGTAWVEEDRADEAAAFEWLRAREGRPTLVTHPGAAYTWSTAPASVTGLPTVVGWQHVAGYHGRAAYERRARAVRNVYDGNASAAVEALDVHGVDYVYVGPVECRAYGRVSFRGIDGVEVAHRSGNVTVYAVDHERLGVSDGMPGSNRFLDGEAC